MASARGGRSQPTEPEVLRAMLQLDGEATVATIGSVMDAWLRQDDITGIVGDLVARGLARQGTTGGWRLTDRGERLARRSRDPFGPYAT